MQYVHEQNLLSGSMLTIVVWYGVQSWLGGQCIVLMLRAMAPQYNKLPSDNLDGTGTRDFVGFFIFWLVSLIFM